MGINFSEVTAKALAKSGGFKGWIIPSLNPFHSFVGFLFALGAESKEAYDNSLREKGFDAGYRQGNIEAAKKFATLLEQNENMQIGLFAIGYYIARLGGSSNEKLSVIVDALGKPDSFARSEYVRSENNKIIRDNPSFEEICNKYLDSLNTEHLKSIDSFLQEIINAGGSSSNEKNFYQNEWSAYLNQRIK